MDPVAFVRRRVSPLYGIINALDYRRLTRAIPMTTGKTRVLGEETLYSDKNGLLHSVDEIFRQQVYRFEASHDAPHIIDAGANIGLSVRYFKKLYPRATIVAYEPDPKIFELLKTNVGHLDGVDLRQAAVWSQDTTLTFYTEGSLAGSSLADTGASGSVLNVKAERLQKELQKRPVDFLKIDIEGAEAEVLFDIEDQLENVECLFFEYHSLPSHPQILGQLLNLVARNGFRYVINGVHGPAAPFIDRIQSGFDLQLNVSCVRS